MKEIPLVGGKFALVDDEDYERVCALGTWRLLREPRRATEYAICWLDVGVARKGRVVRLHRFVLSAPEKVKVDHKNCDGLDNQKSNLRLCTSSQNAGNARRYKNNTSGYKGVSWRAARGVWVSRITKDGIKYQLGSFSTKEEAHAAYCAASEELQGAFARFF